MVYDDIAAFADRVQQQPSNLDAFKAAVDTEKKMRTTYHTVMGNLVAIQALFKDHGKTGDCAKTIAKQAKKGIDDDNMVIDKKLYAALVKKAGVAAV